MRSGAALRRTATHAGAFVAGAVTAVAVAARAEDIGRYRTLDAFAHALSIIQRHHVDRVDERQLVHGAIRGMLAGLDPHSKFYPPRRYQRLRQDTEGEFGGVGISLRRADESDDPPYPIIEDVVPGSPAARSGVGVGQRLLSIDGRATARRGDSMRRGRSLHSLLRGRPGVAVILEVASAAGASRRLRLVHESIKIPSVESFGFADGIGYVRIRKFQEATSRDAAAAVAALGGAELRGLVLDLRGNPGGLFDQAIAVADLFLDGGQVVQVIGRGGTVQERPTASRSRTVTRVALAVLIDEGTASAAEIVAAALQDHDRGELFGVKTFGKGSVQTFFDLPDGSGVKITSARYVSPGGRVIQGGGIAPDRPVEPFQGEVLVAGESPAEVSVRDRWPHLAAATAERLDADFQLLEAYTWLREKAQ